MVWWFPSVRVSVRPSIHPSVRPSQCSALFSYMHWHIDLKFCVSLYFYARKIKFKCHQFPSLFAGVMLLFNFKLLQICSFPHFSPTCFDILSSNFVYDFVFMYHRASLSVVILLHFLLELCLFVNLEYWKYTVFRTFLLHPLTYWAESLHITLFFCTTHGQTIYINLRLFLSYHNASFRTLMYFRSSSSIITLRLPGSPSIHPFSALSSYMHWQI